MNIKILSYWANENENRVLIIGTHNGIFHADEVVACAILCLLHSDMSILILRTRDKKILAQCDICVDIGGGKFDHHMPDFSKSRENGVKYASTGLVWKEFGKQLIQLLLEKYFPKYKCNTDNVFSEFDRSVIALVDCEDNGKPAEKHCFSFISSFLPLWFDNRTDDFNNQFYKVLTTTINVLEEELKTTIGKEIANDILFTTWMDKKKFNNGILEIPSQTISWVETVVTINNYNDNINTLRHITINFVIFPYPDGGWAAQAVPPSLENKFGQRIPFPAEWAGQTDKLPEISGVKDALRCNGRFFVRASTKEAIVEMCTIATMQR